MKIPIVLAQAEIPASVPAAAPATGFGAGAFEAIGRGGQALQRVGELLARTEAIRRQEFAKSEAANAVASFELAAKTGLADLELAERDPDRYQSAADRLIQDTADTTMQGLQSADARALVTRRLAALRADLGIAARQKANTLYRERDAGLRTSTLDARAQLAGLTAIDDLAGFRRHLDAGYAVIAESPSLTAAEKASTRLTYRDRLLGERATRHLEMDPESFLERQAEYAGLGLAPEKRNALTEQAERRIEQRRKDALAQEKTYQEYLDKEATRVGEAMVLDLERAAAEGRGSLEDLNFLIDQRWIERDDAARIRTMIAKAPEEGPSRNQALLAEFQLDAVTPGRVPSPVQVRLANQRGDLNTKDTVALLQTIEQQRNAMESDQRNFHSEAKEYMRAQVGLSAIMDEWDKADKALWKIMMDEFSARSIVTGGREAPMDLAREIAEKVAPMRQQRMILKSLEIRKMLMFGAPNAEAAKARLEQERPRLPRTVYEQQRRLILDLLRMENEENIIRGGGPGTRTFGSGGTQTEGRKRLRKPTETPTSD